MNTLKSILVRLSAALLLCGVQSVAGQFSDYGDFSRFPPASSSLDTRLAIGSKTDADIGIVLTDPLTGLPVGINAPANATATSDDKTDEDDEEGVVAPPSIIQGSAVNVSVTVKNRTGAGAYLNAWLDFDNDGSLTDVLQSTPGGEKLMNQILIPDSASDVTEVITFTVPVTAGPGINRGLRVRLTSVPDPGPDGADGEGEVEDYVVEVKSGGFVYGVSGGSIYQISIATGQGTLASDLVPAITGMGNALAYAQPLGTAGVLIYSTGETGDLRLGVWDRATGAGNVAGDLQAFGMPAGALLRTGAFHGGFYWTILDETDDLWKVAISGTSGAYVITSAAKVSDLWGNARAHGFGDMVVKPDGTLLALGENAATSEAEFFTANLTDGAPVATLLGKPPIFQNGTALGLDGRMYAGLGLSASNADWYELNPANGSVISTITASNLDGVSDLTIAAPDPAPAVSPQDDYGDSSAVPTASSARMNNLRLGGLTDAEHIPEANPAASGDDLSGVDDEDGVLMPSVISRGSAVTIPVNVFNSTIPVCFLNAWIDFDNNGTFDDRLISAGGEKLMSQLTLNSSGSISTQNITFTVPATSSLGTGRTARFRLTSKSNPGPVGKSGSGEVEDYTVTIANSADAISLGDRVFYDEDGNDAQSAPDTGISGAVVKLYSSTDSTRGNSDDKLIGQATTDASGAYQFGGQDEVNMLPVPGTSTTIAAGPGASSDDAEESVASLAVKTADSDLEMGDNSGDPQIVGLRFPNIVVPRGATVTSASIQFMADETQSGSVTFAIEGGNTDNAATFSAAAGNISSRPRTAASVPWSPPNWSVGQKGSGQLTPNLAAIVQEIVSRGGWSSGNALSFFITRTAGSGRRTAETQASGSSQWAVLKITYNISSIAIIQPGGRYFIAMDTADASLAGMIPVRPFLTGVQPADPHSISIANNLVDSNGVLNGTEVLATVLTLSSGGSNSGYDFGFAPSSDYGDFASFPAASSLRKSTIRIGALTDTELNDTLKNDTATGDDDASLDDEDGITAPVSVFQGQTATVTVNVTNTSATTAYLNAWMDFNRDNDVLDAGEQLAANHAIVNGTNGVNRVLTFSIPAGASPGVAGLRVRLTSISSPGPDGADGHGEVEDWVVTIQPVRLDSVMEVRPSGTAEWSPGIALEAGMDADIRLTLTNSGSLTLRDPIIIDLLPASGDTGAVDLAARGSAWQQRLTGPVDVPAGVRPWYSLVQNPQRPEVLFPNPSGSLPPVWFALPLDPGTVRSLKFDGTGLSLEPGASLVISWSMSVPWDATPLTSAVNSAGVSVARSDTGTRMPSFETPRASIQALEPTGELYGDKVWSDANGDGLQTAGETGIDGIRVEFFRDNGDGRSDPNTDTFVAATWSTTINGQAGSYRFGHFPPGDYFAAFAPTDRWMFATPDTGANDAADSDAVEIIRAGRRTGLMPVTRIDAGEQDLTWDGGLRDNSGTPAVWAIAETGSGTILGGRFTSSHGTARNNIVKVTASGTVDTSFNPGTGFNDTVRSVAVRSDGMIWVAGQFTSYNGYPAAGVALLSPTGAWDPRPAQPDTCMVHWAGASGDAMYLAGRFNQVGGIRCGSVARLNADGSVDTAFNGGSGANGPIYDGAVLPNGGLFLAGAFTRFNGTDSRGIVKLSADGSVDTSFNPRGGAAGEVYSIKYIEDGRVHLTGNFRSFDGVACNGTVRLDQLGNVDPTLKPSTLNVDSINSSN